MDKPAKYGAIALFFLFIIGMLWFSDRTPATAAQLEQQEIVRQIVSGSVRWQDAKTKEDAARAERVRQEQGNAGYRFTLCAKFQQAVTASGAVIDAPTCAGF